MKTSERKRKINTIKTVISGKVTASDLQKDTPAMFLYSGGTYTCYNGNNEIIGKQFTETEINNLDGLSAVIILPDNNRKRDIV